MRVAYSTGFWSTNIGNAFFSLGVEYVLKELLGEKNVTVVSDYQTYTTSYGRRLFPIKEQLEYISDLDIDYLVLAGPVLSKYFLKLWGDIIIKLEKRNIRCIFLSTGMMKMTEEALRDCKDFFKKHPPYILCTRDRETFNEFNDYADYAYDGICFAFFTPDYYSPCKMVGDPYIVCNFDKIQEPIITINNDKKDFVFNGEGFSVKSAGLFSNIAKKTDRFSDALIYIESMLPQKKRPDMVGKYKIIRTDHRFHPHFRKKIYAQNNSFCADLPYGYINLYANSVLTMSDRVHACAVTLAYGKYAMLFSKTNRIGLLDRVGAYNISEMPVSLNLKELEAEKNNMKEWLRGKLI